MLTISTRLWNDSALVTLAGDIDMSSADELRPAIESALRRSRFIVVDVGHLSFIDSSGLNALVKARRVVQESGGELRLRNPSPMLRQLLQVTHLESVFVFDPDPNREAVTQSADTVS